MECLGGTRLQIFLTLFTRATPGTPASVKYKWNTDSCGSYIHVIMTLRPTALHSCPYGLILRFSLSQPASSMVGFWQLLLWYVVVCSYQIYFLQAIVAQHGGAVGLIITSMLVRNNNKYADTLAHFKIKSIKWGLFRTFWF